jgi:hypothetical protein
VQTFDRILALAVAVGCITGAFVLIVSDVQIANDTILAFTLLVYSRVIMHDLRAQN